MINILDKIYLILVQAVLAFVLIIEWRLCNNNNNNNINNQYLSHIHSHSVKYRINNNSLTNQGRYYKWRRPTGWVCLCVCCDIDMWAVRGHRVTGSVGTQGKYCVLWYRNVSSKGAQGDWVCCVTREILCVVV
jgi:phage gp36-like protein